MTSELNTQRMALEDLWRKGLSGHELLARHTEMVDSYIIDHFSSALKTKPAHGEIAVIALGGYGRCELYPFSDIDLLLLHNRRAGRYMHDIAEAILYPLWDSGFDVGHSVRTVKDSINFAVTDFFFQVALLDARLLVGSQGLFASLLSRYKKKILEGRRDQFVRTMEEFRSKRRRQYGSHGYLLEPHIKEGKGGMRDIQAMLWTAKAVFGLDSIAAMEEAGLLKSDERKSFTDSWNMLARMRNRLHYISRRKNDQLIFEYQKEMAHAFGYEDEHGVLAVEHFMRQVYGHLQLIAVITDIFSEHVADILDFAGPFPRERELEKSIGVRNGTIRLDRSTDLQARPYLLMRLFLQSGNTGLPLHHNTRQQVTSHLYLVDDKFRSSLRVAKILAAVLVKTAEPLPVLETMLETGLLTAYIPEYGSIETLAQHDLYHIYTVDRHQLQTVAELTRLREAEGRLFQSLVSPKLLYLAAFFHDIGKGKQEDHSELGAVIVGEIGRRLGLTGQERECLSFLVRYHLLLPETALRRDLDDQTFIRHFSNTIGDVDRLTMLYLLTIADSKATGPSAWSSWKASLLAELYLKVKACLVAQCGTQESGAAMAAGEQQGVSWLRNSVSKMLAGEKRTSLSAVDLPDAYLMSFSSESVAGHLRIHRDQQLRLQQQILIFPEKREERWSLLIMSKDRPGLLAKLFGVLAIHNISVLGAQIFTWPDDTVVDVLEILPVMEYDFSDQDWLDLQRDFNQAVNYRLDVSSTLHNKLQQVGFRPRRSVQRVECNVIIDNDTSQRYSVIEVYSEDRMGTLFQLAQAITDFNLDIHRAKIATEVEQLIDIFYVTTRDGHKIDDKRFAKKLRETLVTIIQKEVAYA